MIQSAAGGTASRSDGPVACFQPDSADRIRFELPRAVHLIGAGGSGMRSLAAVLGGAGCRLSGSEHDPSSLDAWLRTQVAISPRSRADGVPAGVGLVVYSAAVPDDHPELRAARLRGIACASYPEMVSRLGRGRDLIAVAGTHGKSTTTAMLATMFAAAGADPTVLVGAIPRGAPSGGRLGRGDLMLAEACEYRRSFLGLAPRAAVILNVEWDHPDCYLNRAQLAGVFAAFASRVAGGGPLVIHAPEAAGFRAAGLARRWTTFGRDPAADWRAAAVMQHRPGYYSFSLSWRGKLLARIALGVPGMHNVHNAVGAAALAHELGMATLDVRRGLEAFAGLRRRIETAAAFGGATVIDDYAHHPSALTATLRTVRAMHPGSRIWCLFQPHQLSRTRHMLDALARSLQNADRVAVLPVFAAREPIEQPRAGGANSGCGSTAESDDPRRVLAAELARRVQAGGAGQRPAVLPAAGEPAALAREVVGEVRSGDVILVVGAGDVGKLRDAIVDRLRRDRSHV